MKSILIAALLLAANFSSAQSERQIVAAVICAEARGEGRDGMCAVYEVISTRARVHRLTLKSEVTTRRWYSCLNHTNPRALVSEMSKTPQWSFAYDIAGRPPATSLARGANHFTKSTESPSWSKGISPVSVIGKHSFYKVK